MSIGDCGAVGPGKKSHLYIDIDIDIIMILSLNIYYIVWHVLDIFLTLCMLCFFFCYVFLGRDSTYYIIYIVH